MKAPLFFAMFAIAAVFAGIFACYDMAKVPPCPREVHWADPCADRPPLKAAPKKVEPMVPDPDDAGR